MSPLKFGAANKFSPVILIFDADFQTYKNNIPYSFA